MSAQEINFDGLVGPTHHYGGHAYGNLASMRNRETTSHPRAAALQGLAKMRELARLGLPQAVLPPHERPHLGVLRAAGFSGSDAEVIRKASGEEPALFESACSAAAMWTANAATVSPSADTRDGRLHLTAANLQANLHRSLEATFSTRLLRHYFSDTRQFAVHEPLPSVSAFGDEGAANHMRLYAGSGEPGLELFVHGRSSEERTARFRSRQTLEACRAIARRHGLDARRVCFIQQLPGAIDAGAFHNDVVAVAHRHVLLLHERAWVDQPAVLEDLRRRFRALAGSELCTLEIPADELSLDDAIRTYLFNSQLVDHPDGGMLLVAPEEVREHPRAHAVVEKLLSASTNPLREARYFALRESMRNGGGPACLRLRVSVTDEQASALPESLFLTEARHDELADWVTRHYRESLTPSELADPALLEETRRALDELTQRLKLGSIYPFQEA